MLWYNFLQCYGIIFTKFILSQAIRSWLIAFLLLIRNVTVWPWSLTFDLELLSYIECHVLKLCTKFEQNWTIRCRIINDTFSPSSLKGWSTLDVSQQCVDRTSLNLEANRAIIDAEDFFRCFVHRNIFCTGWATTDHLKNYNFCIWWRRKAV